MKVCIVTSVYPRNHEDSEVPWLRKTVNLTNQEDDIDVTVFAPSFEGMIPHTIEGTIVKRFRYFFAPLENLTHDEGAPNKIEKLHYKAITLLYILLGTLQLVLLHRREKFDILHVHWPFPHGIMGFVAKMFYPTKIVLNFHGASLLLIKKFAFVKHFLKFFIKRASAIVVNSSYTGKKVTDIYERDVNIIPYGTTVEASNITKTDPFHIISVGRIIERKGFPYLINAMPEIHRRWPKAHLTIVGGGNKLEELQLLVKKLQIESYVKLTGKVSHEELQKCFSGGSIFVLPAIIDSRGDTEGLGVVLIEALSNGCTLVASDVGGIPDVVVNNKSGLLVPEKESNAIVEAVDKLFKDPKLTQSLQKMGEKHVEENFSWEEVIKRLRNVYTKVLA